MSDPILEIKQLRAEIAAHDLRYYKEAQPSIDDQAYDRLKQRLTDLELAYPELALEDSSQEASREL